MEKPKPAVVTRHQRRLVIERLQRAEFDGVTITRTDLGSELGMSGSVLGDVLKDLSTGRGVIASSDAHEVAGRGSRVRWTIKHDVGRVLCFGFSKDSFAVAITDLSGEILDRDGALTLGPCRSRSTKTRRVRSRPPSSMLGRRWTGPVPHPTSSSESP